MVESKAAVAGIVFPGVDQVFSYRIPPHLVGNARAGMRVLAQFGRRRTTGFVVEVRSGEDERATKSLDCLLDAEPVFNPRLLALTKWVAEYYLCSWGDVLKAALPAGVALDEKRYWTLAVPPDDVRLTKFFAAHSQFRVVAESLNESPLTAEQMQRRHSLGRGAALLRDAEQAGVIAYRPVLRPPRVKSRYDSLVLLSATAREQFGTELLARTRSVHEQHLLREVFEAGPDGVLRTDLLRGAGSARRQAFARLLAASLFGLRVEEVTRWNPETESVPPLTEPETLTQDQQAAVSAIVEAVDAERFAPFLLFGVTGSGKTQVYIEAVRHALSQGKTALVLLPEIALTPFVWGRFFRAFGNRVAIQHSAQSAAVRFDLWRDIRAGRYSVVVGARSAVFAPLERFGLIVVDEEQEASYKQEEPAPRYHARDVALVRAQGEKCVAVLGSATPSVESLHHALSGRYHLLRLPERVGGSVMPEVRIVQRVAKPVEREEKGEEKSTKRRARVAELPLFTDELLEQLAGTLESGRQALLLQNRRGFSPFLICGSCGTVPRCPNCSVSLTYHRRGAALRCHYCDHREIAPDACPRCGSGEWLSEGFGTQRLEEETAAHFPQARILRMDTDTVTRRGTHGRMVTAFASGEYDLLVGTQMIAKGLDFPQVGLSAVVQADAEFFYPDFRATERAAALITQVAGRAGRRTEPGKVIVQSAVADHPALEFALKGDWETLVRSELESRTQSGFPPAARLVLLRALGRDESAAARALLRLRRLLTQGGGVETLGPAPAMVARIRGLFRFHLLVRTRRGSDPSGTRLRSAVQGALENYKRARGEAGVSIEVDVDPQTVA